MSEINDDEWNAAAKVLDWATGFVDRTLAMGGGTYEIVRDDGKDFETSTVQIIKHVLTYVLAVMRKRTDVAVLTHAEGDGHYRIFLTYRPRQG